MFLCLLLSQEPSLFLNSILEAFHQTSLSWTPSVPMWQKDVLHTAESTSPLFLLFVRGVNRENNDPKFSGHKNAVFYTKLFAKLSDLKVLFLRWLTASMNCEVSWQVQYIHMPPALALGTYWLVPHRVHEQLHKFCTVAEKIVLLSVGHTMQICFGIKRRTLTKWPFSFWWAHRRFVSRVRNVSWVRRQWNAEVQTGTGAQWTE